MSYFDLSSDGRIPRDGLRKHVQTQIPTEGGALSGLIRFRWTSSQDSWFIPSLSYLMYEFEIQKTGGNIVAADQFEAWFQGFVAHAKCVRWSNLNSRCKVVQNDAIL